MPIMEAMERSDEEKPANNREYLRKWRQAHRSYVNQAHNQWYWKHRDQAIAYQRAYRQRKRDGEPTPLTPVARKYHPLMAYLSILDVGEIILSFRDIADILGSELPPSALKVGNGWWSNQPGKPQSDAWLNAGWRVSRVSRADQTATFTRIRADA
jgi:hypothetical protein